MHSGSVTFLLVRIPSYAIKYNIFLFRIKHKDFRNVSLDSDFEKAEPHKLGEILVKCSLYFF